MSDKCLYCYEALNAGEISFHKKCSRKIFNADTPPVLEITLQEIDDYARKALSKSLAVAGVQPKLSLELQKKRSEPSRLTIVGLYGDYILKPPFKIFPEMPEVEDLTMGMAQLAGIKTAEHSLVKLASGELAYISRRFDRINNSKLHVEDFAQLQEVLTERKYSGSVEKIGKTILKYSSYPGNDVIRFFEVVLFSFLVGNSDMHLKNYSLLRTENDDIQLSPAYDLLATKLLMRGDKEESALTINAKKAKLTKSDFDTFGNYLKITPKALSGVYERFYEAVDSWKEHINKSFLSDKLKTEFSELLVSNMKRIYRDKNVN